MSKDHTLPLSGGWVMINRELPTEVKPPLLSIFYALPDRLFPKGWHLMGAPPWSHRHMTQSLLTLLWRHRNGGRLLPHERKEVTQLEAVLDEEGEGGLELDQRVRILTPDGDVCVEPYEWTPIPDVSVYFGMVDGDHVKLHMLGGVKAAGNLADQIFYMCSRGLSLVECYQFIFGEIKKPNICWFEIHQGYAEFFFGKRQRKRTICEPMQVDVVADKGSHTFIMA